MFAVDKSIRSLFCCRAYFARHYKNGHPTNLNQIIIYIIRGGDVRYDSRRENSDNTSDREDE